ncbi:MAG: ATPase [Candidatus Nephrothrix sp. EaCA]|nr:MAG: ATPase [Candidatus Nephrothrix sp. EaCA]
MKKVCVIGPECTGKTSLSQSLAAHCNTRWVPEYARQYIHELRREYRQEDLTEIAKGQAAMEHETEKSANGLLICDTNLLTIKIWSEYKYKNCDEEIFKLHAKQEYHLYLLTYIDLPWEHDPQREHPDKRDYFWKIYLHEVQQSGIPYRVISGKERAQKAVAAIRQIFYE